MSTLDIGTLRGFLTLDTGRFDTGLGQARVGLSTFLKGSAVAAAAGGVAIGAALSGALVKAMDVQKANSKLAAQLGLTGDQAKVAGERAARLYAGAWGDSLEQVNDAVGAIMTSMNVPDDQVEGLAANVLDLASAYEIDVTRAAQVAGQMITTGLAKDGGQAMDLLAASMQKVPTALREDLLDAVDEYGPAFAAVGVSGEQAMGLLVDASAKGQFGIDKVGDAIKEFGIRSTDMSKASGEAYSALGLDQQKMTDALLAGGDGAKEAFSTIVGGLQSMKDPAAQSQAALALFGTPLEDLNVTEIPAFLGSLDATKAGLEGTDGAMQGLSDTLNGNAATSWESVKRQVGLVATELGTKMLPAASAVANYLAANLGPAMDRVGAVVTGTVIPALRDAAAWLDANRQPILTVAGVITGVLLPGLIAMGVQATIAAAKQAAAWLLIGPSAAAAGVANSIAAVRIVAGWVAMAAAAVVSGAQTAAIWLMYQAQAVASAASTAASMARMVAAYVVGGAQMAASAALTGARVVATWVVMGAQSLIQAARMAAAWFIALGPIGWAIAAIIAIVAVVIANWDTIKRVTVDLWQSAVGYFTRLWKDARVLFFAGVALLVAYATGLARDVNARIDAIREFVVGAFTAMWTFVRDSFVNGVRGAVTAATNLKDGVVGIFESLRDNGKAAFQALVDGIGKAMDGIREATKKPVRFVVERVINDALLGTFNKISGVFGVPKVPNVPLPPGFATGGPIRGPGTGTSDSIDARLSHGEHVWTDAEVKGAGGHQNVMRLRMAARRQDLPAFASGGIVAFGKKAQAAGITVRGHSQFPPVGRHRPGSDHYNDDAVDLNADGRSQAENVILTPWLKAAQQAGYTVYYNFPGFQHLAGHADHGHVADKHGKGGAVSAALSAIGSAISDPGQLVRAAVDKLIGGAGRLGESPFGKLAMGVPKTLAAGAVDKLKSLLGGQAADESTIGTPPGGKGFKPAVERWRGTALEALARVGAPASLVDKMLRRLDQESGGDPRAINLWDSNAKKGTPSKGLLQTIDSTFQRWRDKALPNDVYHPLANMVASLNYAKGTYPSIAAAYDRAGGYAAGTASAVPGMRWVGENGPELMAFRGGEKVVPARQSQRMDAAAQTMPSVLEVRDVDGALIGRMRVEGQRAVSESERSATVSAHYSMAGAY